MSIRVPWVKKAGRMGEVDGILCKVFPFLEIFEGNPARKRAIRRKTYVTRVSPRIWKVNFWKKEGQIGGEEGRSDRSAGVEQEPEFLELGPGSFLVELWRRPRFSGGNRSQC